MKLYMFVGRKTQIVAKKYLKTNLLDIKRFFHNRDSLNRFMRTLIPALKYNKD